MVEIWIKGNVLKNKGESTCVGDPLLCIHEFKEIFIILLCKSSRNTRLFFQKRQISQ